MAMVVDEDVVVIAILETEVDFKVILPEMTIDQMVSKVIMATHTTIMEVVIRREEVHQGVVKEVDLPVEAHQGVMHEEEVATTRRGVLAGPASNNRWHKGEILHVSELSSFGANSSMICDFIFALIKIVENLTVTFSFC